MDRTGDIPLFAIRGQPYHRTQLNGANFSPVAVPDSFRPGRMLLLGGGPGRLGGSERERGRRLRIGGRNGANGGSAWRPVNRCLERCA